MLKKVKPEKVAGIVALSYLVLIPAGAIFAWQRIKAVDQDVTTMWMHLGLDHSSSPKSQKRDTMKRFIQDWKV